MQLDVFRLVGTQRIEVPTELTVTGMNQEGEQVGLSLLLEVPIDADERRGKIEAYLARAKATASQLDEVTQEDVNLFDVLREDAITALEELYVENSVGEYEVVCSFRSEPAAEFNKSEAERFRVIFEGEPLNQPGFQIK